MKTISYDGKKMLVVVAHPDDETFGMGGTIALYANLGVEIHLISTTRGEAGEVDPDKLKKFSSIGELREHELCCAAKVLKIKKVHFLGYRDSGMPGSEDNKHPNAFINAPLNIVSEKIAIKIREIKPDIVLTFDPIGGYMHPDHIATNKATVAAFRLARNSDFITDNSRVFKPKRLFFHVFPRGFFKLIVNIMPLFGKDPTKFGKNKDIDLKAVLAEDYPTHVKVNYRKYAELREQASMCHASQGGDRQSGYFITWIMRLFNSTEYYMQAYPPIRNGTIKRDLFAGI